MSQRIAVVLFNLGGPDNPDAIRPFLFNLFADPAIIRIPNPARVILAWATAKKRTRQAKGIYAELGGGSPLLPNTEAQARALEAALADLGEVKVFIAMRYWHPMSQGTTMLVNDFAPDKVILLPLYPQFSTTTTGSSVRMWREACRIARLDVPTRLLCCYPTESRFIATMAAGLRFGVPRRDDYRCRSNYMARGGVPFLTAISTELLLLYSPRRRRRRSEHGRCASAITALC